MIVPHQSLRTGLVGAWCPTLGSTGYTLLDRSGRGNHGTLTNMGGQNNWRADAGGTALSFDGTNDFVVLGTATKIGWSVVRSISFWLYPRSSADSDVLTMYDLVVGVNQRTLSQGFRGGVFSQYWPSSGDVDGTGLTASSVTLNRWSHVCSVFRNGVRELWANGRLASSVSQAAINTSASTSRLGIGAIIGTTSDTPAFFSNVMVDDVRLYNRPMAQAEILLLASQRGIGLRQTNTHRTSASSRRLYTRVNGAWKETRPFVNVGGVWKEGAIWQKVGGAWKN